MPNIVLSRIDERLIHGQVGAWVGFAGQTVLVANDEVAGRSSAAKPDGNGTGRRDRRTLLVTTKVIDNIHRAADRQKILLVCKSPADFFRLVEGGVPVNRINVGNMHYANGKQQIAKTVSVDAADITAFNGLKAAGVECFVQGVPTEPAQTSINFSEGFTMEISLLQAFALGILAFIAGPICSTVNAHAPPGCSRAAGRPDSGRSAYWYFNRWYAGTGVDGSGPTGRSSAAKRDYRHYRGNHVCHNDRSET